MLTKKNAALLIFGIMMSSYSHARYDYNGYDDGPEYNYQSDGYYENNNNYYYNDEPPARHRRHESQFVDYDDGYDDYPPPRQKRNRYEKNKARSVERTSSSLAAVIPAPLEKVIIVDPRKHAWGAYDASGRLLRSGLATAGSSWCSDIGRPCRTKVGSFRIYSLGDETCISKRYPVPDGGAPMPYCMYFNGSEAIHGSYEVVRGNVSHGCVRVHVEDAEWLRYEFVESSNSTNQYRGTKVIIRSY